VLSIVLRRYGAAHGVALAVVEASFAAVHVPSQRRRVSRFAQVAGGCAAVALLVVALAAVQERGQISLDEVGTASSFQQDSEAAIKIKVARDHYDEARSQVHTLKEGLEGLEKSLKEHLGVMDAARDDLVKRIRKVEKLPDPPQSAESGPADAKQQAAVSPDPPKAESSGSSQKWAVKGGTELASSPLNRPEFRALEDAAAALTEPAAPASKASLAEVDGTQGKVKDIARKIMFPNDGDASDPLTSITGTVIKQGWGGKTASFDKAMKDAAHEKSYSTDPSPKGFCRVNGLLKPCPKPGRIMCLSNRV